MSVLEVFGIKKLKEEFEELQQKYKILKIDFERKNQEIDRLKLEKIKIFNDVKNKNTEIIIFGDKLKELEKDNLDLKQEISILKKNNIKLENENSELKRNSIELEDENSELNLKKEIFVREQIKKINEIKNDFMEKLSIANNEKKELIHLKSDLEEKILRKEKINLRIKDELSEALRNNEALNKETLEIKREIVDIEEKFKDLEKEIDNKNIQIQDLTIKIENLTWQNKEKENKLLVEKRYTESLEKEKNSCKDIYKKQVEDLKEELITFKKIYKELENNSKTLESECLEEKKKNIKILKELEEYKDKLAKIEEKADKAQGNKQENKEKEEIKPIEVKNIEEKNVQKEPLKEKKVQEKVKVERKPIDSVEKIIKKQTSSNLKWNNYEEFIKNENNLIEYLKSFSIEDFQSIYCQVKERGIIKKAQEKYFSNIIIKLKQGLFITSNDIENIEPLYKELMDLIFNKNKKEKLSLLNVEVDNLQENKEKEEVNLIEVRSIEEKNIQKEPSEEKKVQEKPKVRIASVEETIKRQNSSNLKWNNYEEFIKNEDNLVEYLKSFSIEDFQSIYYQVKERGIIKKAQEKYFSNILIRIKWKLSLTNMDIEKIELLYKELMKQLLKENKDDKSEFKDKKIVREKNTRDEKIDEEIMNILF